MMPREDAIDLIPLYAGGDLDAASTALLDGAGQVVHGPFGQHVPTRADGEVHAVESDLGGGFGHGVVLQELQVFGEDADRALAGAHTPGGRAGGASEQGKRGQTRSAAQERTT